MKMEPLSSNPCQGARFIRRDETNGECFTQNYSFSDISIITIQYSTFSRLRALQGADYQIEECVMVCMYGWCLQGMQGRSPGGT